MGSKQTNATTVGSRCRGRRKKRVQAHLLDPGTSSETTWRLGNLYRLCASTRPRLFVSSSSIYPYFNFRRPSSVRLYLDSLHGIPANLIGRRENARECRMGYSDRHGPPYLGSIIYTGYFGVLAKCARYLPLTRCTFGMTLSCSQQASPISLSVCVSRLEAHHVLSWPACVQHGSVQPYSHRLASALIEPLDSFRFTASIAH